MRKLVYRASYLCQGWLFRLSREGSIPQTPLLEPVHFYEEVAMSEASAVNGAFEEQVGTLFKGLVVNLGDAAVTHKTDQQCLDMFTTGLNLARKARQMALTVTSKT